MQDIADALRAFDTPTLANAIELLKVRHRMTGFCSRQMRHLTPGMGVMCGYAVTVQAETAVAEPRDRADTVDRYIDVCRAIEKAPKPTVVVFEEFGPHAAYSAHVGDVLATMFRYFGAIGAVSDSAVRDLHELRALGFQAFAPGTVASRAHHSIRCVQTPVRICGLTVHPGDLLHGDENGLISIPGQGRDRLPELAQQVRAREKVVLEYMKRPDVTLAGLRERLVR